MAYSGSTTIRELPEFQADTRELGDETKPCNQIHQVNPLGLHTPYHQAWNACYKRDSREPNEDQSNIRTCTCGKRFDSKEERDAHCMGNADTGAHGRTSDELEALGGAHVWVDPNSGKVLQARAYPIPHQGHGTTSSARFESATSAYATLGL